MQTRRLIVLTTLISLLAATTWAGDRGTPDEAKEMAQTAAAYLKQVGPDVALAAFNAKDGRWHDRDLYVFVTDQSNVVRANGSTPALVGHNVSKVSDADGKYFQVAISAVTGADWVDYKWQNPITKAIEVKTTYVVRVGEYSVGVGAYK